MGNSNGKATANGKAAARGAVLVTGCSTGIGHAVAVHLAEHGYRVFAGVRSAESGTALAEETGGRVEQVLLDVTDPQQITEAVATLHRATGGVLLGLVNNAGVALPAATELSSVDDVRHLMEVNTIGPLRLTQECLPMLRAGVRELGRGRVVNITSLNGRVTTPMVGAYAASKYAVEALSDALRVELRPWGVHVSVVRPGQVQTAIFDKARDELADRAERIPDELREGYEVLYYRASRFNERGAASTTKPSSVATIVHRALTARRPRAYYTVGWDAWGMILAKKYVPIPILDRVYARIMGLNATVKTER